MNLIINKGEVLIIMGLIIMLGFGLFIPIYIDSIGYPFFIKNAFLTPLQIIFISIMCMGGLMLVKGDIIDSEIQFKEDQEERLRQVERNIEVSK